MSTLTNEETTDIATLRKLIAGGLLGSPAVKQFVEDLERGRTVGKIFTPPPINDTCIKYKTAAEMLNCSKAKIKKLAYSGHLQRFYSGRSAVAAGITHSSLAEYITKGKIRPQPIPLQLLA